MFVVQWKHTVKRTLGKWFYGKDLVMKKLASRAWRDFRVAKQRSRTLHRRAAQHGRRRLTAAAWGEWRCVRGVARLRRESRPSAMALLHTAAPREVGTCASSGLLSNATEVGKMAGA